MLLHRVRDVKEDGDSFLFAVTLFLTGTSVFAAAKGAIHEIEGLILFLIGAVFLSSAGIVEAITLVRKRIEKTLNPPI